MALNPDPVTGRLNAGLARWMIDSQIAGQHYSAAQGTAIGCEGRVHVDVEDGTIWGGGNVMSCVNGEVQF